MAIDRDAIIKDVYLGAGEKAKTLIPPTMWSYNDKIRRLPYDPEKAKAMLAAAGVKTPLDIDLWYMPVSRPYNPNGKRIGEMMQADLAKVGVNAKLVDLRMGRISQAPRQRRAHDRRRSAGPATTAIPTISSSCAAAPAASPATATRRNGATRSSTICWPRRASISDQGERAKLYQRMQEIEHDEAPELLHRPFDRVRGRCARRSTGYKQSPLGTHAFEGVDLK